VTSEPWRSPLGRRLLLAFLIVALSSVAVLTAAALIGTNQGLAIAQRDERQQVADRAGTAAAQAYQQAGGWGGIDLNAAAAIADGAGARLVVQDSASMMIWPGHGMGPGAGGLQSAAAVSEAPIIADGQRVGTVRLAFAGGVATGRSVAWSWVIGAAAVALLAALLVSRYVVRRLIRPLVAMANAARRFAAGDRTARAALSGPGELGEMTRALNTMANEVVHTEQIRRHLAADVAHELRTPLAALQAGLEELRDGLRPADPERLGALHDQTLRLGRIVQDLADLSAAESAALSLHPAETDLTYIAATALVAQQPQLDAAGLRVHTDLPGPVPVLADPDRLHQAVANVLSNAVRYCRPDDHLTIRTYVDGTTAALDVSDSGPGIPADELPHIFDRLWRGQQARATSGSGIGLAVVRELVTAHGGTVAAHSAANAGTTISIHLPLAAPLRR
jgi:two-component system sensor histidine kinase BaeS